MTRYFAYGSNLVVERMEERGAPFRSAQPAVLRGHRLVFDKLGRDGYARANVEPDPAGRVHGVVYELARDGLDTLALFEGGYDAVEVEVEGTGADGVLRLVKATTFVARPERRTTAPPSRAYVALILQGIQQHQLPAQARAEVERAALARAGVVQASRSRARG